MLRVSAPRWVAALLTAAIALRVLTLATEPTRTLAAIRADVTPPRAGKANIDAIVNANLFGKPSAGVGDAPASTATLVLAGVVARTDPAAGLAVLGPTIESTALYHGGDELQAGVRLKAIYRDYVLLERAGQLERVDMHQSLPSAALLSAAIVAAAAVDRSPVPRPRRQVRVMVGEVIRTQLVRANGQLKGYRVFPGAEQQTFERLGLRAGDVVLSVNGRKAGDADGGDLMQVLKADRRAQVTIARGGVQQEVVLNVDDVST